MTNLMEVFQSIIQRFEDADISYMVVGSVASIVYGEPRMTKDMDLVIDIRIQDVSKLEKFFPFKDFYCPPSEILNAEVSERGQFNLIHHNSGLKIDIMVRKNSDHAVEEFKRRKRVPFWANFQAYLASPEDVIIKKLDFYRSGRSFKHLTDIRGILAQTPIDLAYMQHWIQKLGLQAEWLEAQ